MVRTTEKASDCELFMSWGLPPMRVPKSLSTTHFWHLLVPVFTNWHKLCCNQMPLKNYPDSCQMISHSHDYDTIVIWFCHACAVKFAFIWWDFYWLSIEDVFTHIWSYLPHRENSLAKWTLWRWKSICSLLSQYHWMSSNDDPTSNSTGPIPRPCHRWFVSHTRWPIQFQ